MKKIDGLKSSIIMFMLALLTGCGHMLDDTGLRDETIYEPAYPEESKQPVQANGTIYKSGHEIALYEDRIAHRVGDIISIKLEETTQGQKKAKTKANKTASNNFQTPTIAGGEITGLAFNTATDQQFNGEGETNEQNSLQGKISGTIVRVLSNGNLIVQGESWLTINQGREYIRLTGIVRREDIDENNEISSQRVAHARISYSGNGQVGNVSRGGVLTQMFNKFFPY